jgi:hypothetical protein
MSLWQRGERTICQGQFYDKFHPVFRRIRCATLGRTNPWIIDRHYPEGRRPELRAIRDREVRLPPGKSILLIGVLSLLSWLALISVVMVLWQTV